MKFKTNVIHKGTFYPAGTDVPVDAPVKVELTDNVPDGALDTNADGSVNAYDAEGNVVGSVDAENVEKLQEQAGGALTNQNMSDKEQDDAGEDSDEQSDADVGQKVSDESAQEQEKPKRGRKSKEE